MEKHEAEKSPVLWLNCPNHRREKKPCTAKIPIGKDARPALTFCMQCDEGPLWICPNCNALASLGQKNCLACGLPTAKIEAPAELRSLAPALETEDESLLGEVMEGVLKDWKGGGMIGKMDSKLAGLFGKTVDLSDLKGAAFDGELEKFEPETPKPRNLETLKPTAAADREVNEPFANAYRRAALDGADMFAFAALVEPLRKKMLESNDTLSVRAAFDAAIAGTGERQHVGYLLQLRVEWLDWQKKHWLDELRTLSATPDADVWMFFLNRYVEAMRFWRMRFAAWYAGEVLDDKTLFLKIFKNEKPAAEDVSEKRNLLERMRDQAILLDQARWPEAKPFLAELAENELLTPKNESFLLTVIGGIYIYHMFPHEAEPWLKRAEEAFPDLQYLSYQRADWPRQDGRFEEAEQLFAEHLERFPKDAFGHTSLAQCFISEKKYEQALRCIDHAIEADPGDVGALRMKITLWGSDSVFFKENESKIGPLVERIVEIEPDAEVTTNVEAAVAFLNQQRWDEAEFFYKKALAADPTNPESLLNLGYLHTERALRSDGDKDVFWKKGAAFFEQAIALAPGYFYPYWHRANVDAEHGRHAEAAAWFEKSLPHCPFFERLALSKAAEMYGEAGNLDKAKSLAFKAFDLDPTYPTAWDTLLGLINKFRDRAYDELQDPALALDFLKELRERNPAWAEYDFQNRTGNIHYYFKNYKLAESCYRRAIAHRPGDPVLYDNLAGALENQAINTDATLVEKRLALLDEALEKSAKACELAPENASYRQQRQGIERKLVPLRQFGVFAEARSASPEPIYVRIQESLGQFWVPDGSNLLPELLEKLSVLRTEIKDEYGYELPPVKFNYAWTIPADQSYIVDFDRVPVYNGLVFPGKIYVAGPTREQLEQRGVAFSEDNLPGVFWVAPEDMPRLAELQPFRSGTDVDALIFTLRQHLKLNLADFLHYDSPEIAARFVGKSLPYATGFFRVAQGLLRQRIGIRKLDLITRLYDAGFEQGKPALGIIRDIRSHADILPDLPVNRSTERELIFLPKELETNILEQTGDTAFGQKVLKFDPSSKAFFELLDYLMLLPSVSIPGEPEKFVIVENPALATLLHDLQPGSFFSKNEVVERAVSAPPNKSGG